jgi:hypothetical protein
MADSALLLLDEVLDKIADPLVSDTLDMLRTGGFEARIRFFGTN